LFSDFRKQIVSLAKAIRAVEQPFVSLGIISGFRPTLAAIPPLAPLPFEAKSLQSLFALNPAGK
jgi:hypothetical protein